MTLNSMPIFAVMEQRMRWLGERHSVLAQNIANADTPGYKARDLAPMDFNSVIRDALARGRGDAGGFDRGPETQILDDPYEVTLSGNTVVIEQQMMKVAETAAQYRMASNLYTKYLSMMRIAVSGRR